MYTLVADADGWSWIVPDGVLVGDGGGGTCSLLEDNGWS